MHGSRVFLAAVIASCLGLPCHSQPATPPPAAKPESAKARESNNPFEKLTEFSATMVGGPLGNIDETKIYRSGNLMRTTMLDGKNYMITNLDRYDTFVVLPDRCMHDARPALNTFPFTAIHPGNRVSRSALGTEVVDGHSCQVEEVTITSEYGKDVKLKLWEASDLNGFPVKVEVYRKAGSPVAIAYKDITIGPPDPALFAHPATCEAPPAATKKKSPSQAPKSKPQNKLAPN